MAGKLTFGQRAADFAAAWIGSWAFLIWFNVFLLIWVGLNSIEGLAHWDGYPFTFLNLVLSWLAGVQAPLIMISQNRQEEISRQQQKYMLNMQEAVYAFIVKENPALACKADNIEADGVVQ